MSRLSARFVIQRRVTLTDSVSVGICRACFSWDWWKAIVSKELAQLERVLTNRPPRG